MLPKTLMKRYNLIHMFLSYSNGLLNFKSKTSGQGERGIPGVGFNLTSGGNYDMVNKKLANVDTAMIDKHDNNHNIDLKDTYNVINSKEKCTVK